MCMLAEDRRWRVVGVPVFVGVLVHEPWVTTAAVVTVTVRVIHRGGGGGLAAACAAVTHVDIHDLVGLSVDIHGAGRGIDCAFAAVC